MGHVSRTEKLAWMGPAHPGNFRQNVARQNQQQSLQPHGRTECQMALMRKHIFDQTGFVVFLCPLKCPVMKSNIVKIN